MNPVPSDRDEVIDQVVAYENFFRNTRLPLFGLPTTFKGLRCLGDCNRALEQQGREGARVLVAESYGLAHGDPFSSTGPTLQAISSVGLAPDREALLELESARGSAEVSALRGLITVEVDVSVDGEPVKFRGIHAQEVWAVQVARAGYDITLIGARMPTKSISLVRIDDLEPYVRGRRDLLESRHPEFWRDAPSPSD